MRRRRREKEACAGKEERRRGNLANGVSSKKVEQKGQAGRVGEEKGKQKE